MQQNSPDTGLHAVFLASRERLLRFFLARGAGDDAEDLLQELWLKLAASNPGPVSAPLSYLFRAANMLMIDRYRSVRQADKRDRDWADAQAGSAPGVATAPSAERVIAGRQFARLVGQALDELEPRAAAIFRRHRMDEVPQKQIASEFGVSLSTVESDLRQAYRALAELRKRIDEA